MLLVLQSFQEQNQSIRSAFPDHTLNPVEVDSLQVNSLLASFIPATADEVRKIIMSSPNKSCDLDPLPTTLLKACLDTLHYPITIHFLRTLPKENLNSYKLISNLSFISKALEKVVASRLRSHMESNCMSNALQSAFK